MDLTREQSQQLLSTHTPEYLQQHIPEFMGEDPDEQADGASNASNNGSPIHSYAPFASGAELVGSFMMHCSACCYLNDPDTGMPNEEG